MGKWIRIGGVLVTALIVVVSIRACQLGNQTEQQLLNDSQQEEPEKSGLTLRDVTLEQPDEDGVLLWRVKGKEVTYSPDQQVAFVTLPDGELYQDGKLVYRVKAKTGEIRENGKIVFLRGDIVATGIESGAVLRGNELEWQANQDVLIVRDQITGTHPQIQAQAQEARVYNRDKRMELEGDVVANTVVEDSKTDPWLKLQADALTWHWEQEQVETDQPLRVERFEENQISDVITGQQGTVDLATEVATLRQDVKMQLLKVPLVAQSDLMVWQVAEEKVSTDQPIRLIDPQQKVTVAARQGRMDLAQEIVYLQQDVVAQGERNQSRLTSDRLTWNMQAQTVVAEGNVNYRQVDPVFNLTGPKAVGHLQDETIVVSGGRVITQIQPDLD